MKNRTGVNVIGWPWVALVAFTLYITASTATAQVKMVEPELPDLSVQFGRPVELSFELNEPGRVTQICWPEFDDRLHPSLKVTYVLPSGDEAPRSPHFEGCVFLRDFKDLGFNDRPQANQEASGEWLLRLEETVDRPSYNITPRIGIVVQRPMNANVPITGAYVPQLSSVDDIVVKWMRKFEFEAAAVAILNDDRLVLSRGYGWKDEARTQALDPDTTMRIATPTVQLTKRAAQQLEADGLLSMDEKIFDILDIPPPRCLMRRSAPVSAT